MSKPTVEHSIAGARETIGSLRARAVASGIPHPRVALVPTMGALHPGHLALVAHAAEVADIVVVSIFVNPLQFGDKTDLEAYPRTLDSDVALLEGRGVDLVFAPSAAEMYPNGSVATRVTGGDVAQRFEGRSRRGHFDGVLTVVTKLLNIIGPDIAVFGQKDAQQAFLVTRMARELDFPTTVQVVETVREPDGLAMSSRNRRLGERERRAARVLHQALDAAVSAADGGIDASIAAAQSALMGEDLVRLDHLSIIDPATFQPASDSHKGAALIVIAAEVGGVRLIDNDTAFFG